MKIAVITIHFRPKHGGDIAYVCENFYNYFKKEHEVHIFNDLWIIPERKIYKLDGVNER